MDNKTRCAWAESDPLSLAYHDTEYGRSVEGDDALFFALCLEIFQAGLSWRTVLQKREALSAAFAGFSLAACAALTDAQLEAQTFNAAIIRHRGKIFGIRQNARAILAAFPASGQFSAYVYSGISAAALQRTLKKAGCTFCGPGVCTSFLQSVGVLPAHEPGCFLHHLP